MSLSLACAVAISLAISKVPSKQLLTEREYFDYREKYGSAFRAGMGAESVKEVLNKIDLEKLSDELRKTLDGSTGQKKLKLTRRLEVVEAFRKSGNNPSWMILDVVPVIPATFLFCVSPVHSVRMTGSGC